MLLRAAKSPIIGLNCFYEMRISRCRLSDVALNMLVMLSMGSFSLAVKLLNSFTLIFLISIR